MGEGHGVSQLLCEGAITYSLTISIAFGAHDYSAVAIQPYYRQFFKRWW